MPETKLSRRLYAAFLLVRGGGAVADIGTDHAYLPIALVKSGKVKSAIASDINEGPLETARENIHIAGLDALITTHLGNGVEGLEGTSQEFVIAGMGGELIAEIIEKAPFLKNFDVHLVLQPMTKVRFLRSWLWDNGFDILKEIHLEESGHVYTVMSVVYTCDKYYRAPIEEIVGKLIFLETHEKDSLLALLKTCEKNLAQLSQKINGKTKAGLDFSEEVGERESILRICEIIRSKI